MTRGRCGSLPLHRSGLSPLTSCRSPGAPWLNPPPHPITVYASHPPSPTTAQHSLPGSALPPYRGRSFTGRIASASPDAPEPEVRIHLSPAGSPLRTQFVQRRLCRCSARASVNIAGRLANETTMPVSRTPWRHRSRKAPPTPATLRPLDREGVLRAEERVILVRPSS